MIDQILAAVNDRSPRGIAEGISGLIRSGAIPDGDRLPTVREVALALAVSPATVSNAWQAMAAVGLIASRGRAGSFVRRADARWMPARMGGLAGSHIAAELDLSTGIPDPDLLPRLDRALGGLPDRASTENYLAAPVIPELDALLRATWPVPGHAITVLDGTVDAVARTLDLVARFGDRVIVEDPGFPAFLDLAELSGLVRIPVARDAHGMIPAALDDAMRHHPVAILIQPRAHNPTGTSLHPERAAELARVIRRHSHVCDPYVIEDDHSGQISGSPDVTLGTWLPHRTVHIRGFSKSHGPDLRIAAVGGPEALIDRIMTRRLLGPAWTSRLLQRILAELLVDAQAITQISEARRAYVARQRALADALGAVGVEHRPGDGVNTWLRVRDERAALLNLAAAGVRVAAGSPFFAAAEPDDQHIRVTVGLVRADVDGVARRLAAASVA